MSKLKSDIIQKIYKENYLCKLGHNVTWVGKKYINSGLECNKCGNEAGKLSIIRWQCSECKHYYCRFCYDLLISKYCPLKHKYKFYKQNEVDFFMNYTCDSCFEKLLSKDGVLYDPECDLTICPKCFYESYDIPEVIED